MQTNEHLARLAMECIATWSTVESWMLNFYINLAGGNKSDSAAMFLALDSSSAKSNALTPFIQKLDVRYQRLYAAVLKLLRSRQKSRDKLAHWVWGYSAELPDSLLLADPRVMVTVDKTVHSYLLILAENVFVYREADFRKIIQNNEELAGYGFKLAWIISGHIANRDDRLYVKLCQEPSIREILNR